MLSMSINGIQSSRPVPFRKVCMSVLRNISLSRKLLLILLFPMIGFLWLAGLFVADNAQTLRMMDRTVQASAVAQQISQLITTLQRERGASGVYLGSRGQVMKNRLPRMRADTDQAISALRATGGSDQLLEKLMLSLDDLQNIRGQVDSFSLTNQQSGARFTEIIKGFIGYTHSLEAGVNVVELGRALGSLNQLIELKERAGRERAMLGIVFNQDSFDAALLAGFSRNLGEFSAYMDTFRRTAAPEFVRELDAAMQQPVAQEVARLQQLAFRVPLGESLGVNGEQWFEKATARIDLMGRIGDELGQAVGEFAQQAYDQALRALMLSIAMVVGSLLAVSALSYLIIRNINLAVRDVNQTLAGLSARDLSVRSRYQGNDEFGQIARNLNRTAEELRHVVQEIGGATTQVATAAEECSAVTLQTSQSVEQQRQGTELVVTAIHQMSATVRDVARSTSDAADMSRKVNDSTSQGRAEVEETVQLIRQLSAQANQTAETISDLKEESDSISSVIDVIRGIAEQTNLLALNAAIEAARAGDHGRGFAVVASEVRVLAQKTQESTGSIQEMIANLQSGADKASRSMQETLAKAQAGAGKIGRAGELLAEIAEGVAGISDRNIQIASAAEEQSSVAEDINRNVLAINDVAIQVSAGAEQTAATSLELARLAEQQQELVGRFKVA